MVIRETECRSILTRTRGYLSNVASHSLNPYSGCGLGNTLCGVGCYVRSNPWITRGRAWGAFVDVKTNAPEVYMQTVDKERAWANRQSQNFVLFLSSSTEPWQPAERKWRVTRKLLHAMLERPPQGLILQTHSTHALDDMDVIVELAGRCALRLHVSIESDRNFLPGLPTSGCSVDKRIEMVHRLSSQGVATVVCASPLLPITEPETFFKRLASAGARAIIVDHFIGGDGSEDGGRTLKTDLPNAMSQVHSPSVTLEYRDQIIAIAKKYLPVGVSADGFAGNFSAKQTPV